MKSRWRLSRFSPLIEICANSFSSHRDGAEAGMKRDVALTTLIEQQ